MQAITTAASQDRSTAINRSLGCLNFSAPSTKASSGVAASTVPEPFGWGTGEINAPREEGLIGHRESFEMCSLAHERHHVLRVC